VGPEFKIVLLSALGLTLLSFVVGVLLALQSVQTPTVVGLIETCSTVFKLGCGAVFGLLGGKSL
jgi:putative Mn2+ efflux pump MntP